MPGLPLQGAKLYTCHGWDDAPYNASVSQLTNDIFPRAGGTTGFRLPFFRHDQNQGLSAVLQLPHRWQPQTIVRPHAHVVPAAPILVPRVVILSGRWAFAGGKYAIEAAAWERFEVELRLDRGAEYLIQIIDFSRGEGVKPPEGLLESDVFLLELMRNGTDLRDTYTDSKPEGVAAANLGLLALDVHYQACKAGTAPDFPR